MFIVNIYISHLLIIFSIFVNGNIIIIFIIIINFLITL
jgi:hypothetical protein